MCSNTLQNFLNLSKMTKSTGTFDMEGKRAEGPPRQLHPNLTTRRHAKAKYISPKSTLLLLLTFKGASMKQEILCAHLPLRGKRLFFSFFFNTPATFFPPLQTWLKPAALFLF